MKIKISLSNEVTHEMRISDRKLGVVFNTAQ